MFPGYCLSLAGTLTYYISEYLVHTVFRERNISSVKHKNIITEEIMNKMGQRGLEYMLLLPYLTCLFNNNTWLFNNSLLPLLDSFTVSLLDTCSVPLCAKMKKLSTGEKEYGNKLKGFMWQSQKIRWLYFLRN